MYQYNIPSNFRFLLSNSAIRSIWSNSKTWSTGHVEHTTRDSEVNVNCWHRYISTCQTYQYDMSNSSKYSRWNVKPTNTFCTTRQIHQYLLYMSNPPILSVQHVKPTNTFCTTRQTHQYFLYNISNSPILSVRHVKLTNIFCTTRKTH